MKQDSNKNKDNTNNYKNSLACLGLCTNFIFFFNCMKENLLK